MRWEIDWSAQDGVAVLAVGGRLSGQGIRDMRAEFAADPRAAGVTGFIVDISTTDVRDVSAADIQGLAATSRSVLGPLQRAPRAYVVGEGLMYGLASLYLGRLSGAEAPSTELFLTRSEAESWVRTQLPQA